ncbi:MAG TPA: TssN family type VI secretion system protein [Bacteroidales bacterium]|nr:TssN family type VI secretion system protein [Bacteroidales bacterium]
MINKVTNNPYNLAPILIFSILGLGLILVISFFVPAAKKKTGLNTIYILIGSILLGLPGLRAGAINHLWYFYLVIMIWNFIMGSLHLFLSGKILGWPKTEPVGWRFLFALAIVLIGYTALMTFMGIGGYKLPSFFVWYYLSAVLTFFIPLSFLYAIECFQAIPERIYLQQPWIYKQGSELEWDPNQVSHFVLVRYKLAPQTGSPMIESLPMIAPQDLRLGDYFNSTLEYDKVTQGQYDIEVRDRSNNSLGWYFFLADGSATGRFLDPNRTFLELGMKNLVFFGQANPDEMQSLKAKFDREGKTYTIICKREHEYKSQLLKA